ncbi:MAG: ATP-binding cassette domain-containing protein [Cyclobacteriaceae bacterium]|nr:ATP-binding cassette domain-containing protein [Cyclobacteriaceae bacterium]
MEIQLEQVAKKFNKEWIFRNINFTLSESQPTAIIGPNGSGKSTLLQVIAGSMIPTSGRLHYRHANKQISADQIYQYISMAAPSMALPEDFTLGEFLAFHFKFKTLKSGYHLDDLPDIFRLEQARDKYIKNFSTGMKQRLKLGVAFYADTPLLLLDEPLSNLDHMGIAWYLEEIDKVLKEKMIFVCSNRMDEYPFCKTFIDILEFKRP